MAIIRSHDRPLLANLPGLQGEEADTYPSGDRERGHQLPGSCPGARRLQGGRPSQAAPAHRALQALLGRSSSRPLPTGAGVVAVRQQGRLQLAPAASPGVPCALPALSDAGKQPSLRPTPSALRHAGHLRIPVPPKPSSRPGSRPGSGGPYCCLGVTALAPLAEEAPGGDHQGLVG